MRSEGFPFYTLGVWGLRCVRWMPLLCPQPSATVRERTCGRKLAVPLGSFTEVVIFGRFTSLQPSFRVAGVALRDMWTCLAMVKIVFRGRCNTFATFSKDALHFSWQAQHFGRVRLNFSWQAQYFTRVVLRVFRKSHWHGCAHWQPRANSVAGVAFRDTCQNWRKSRTKCSF